MAIPVQQQALVRKVLYGLLILVLFLCGWLWRRYIIDPDAEALAIREHHHGEVELVGAVVRQSLIGSRGFVTCYLWVDMQNMMKRNQWSELEVTARALAKLQPHYVNPWLFQSWNLAYNVSVEADRVRDKYFFITRGIQLLGEGERRNHFDPDLRWHMGFFLEHKVCQSDDSNTLRSLLQLSCIPPNQRDPARFRVMKNGHLEIDMVEFENFCKEHPHLVRRLKDGMMREMLSDIKRQFICESPEAIVQFLDDNYRVPSYYPDVPPWKEPWKQDKTWLAESGRAEREKDWDNERKRLMREPDPLPKKDALDRFPVLPPPPDTWARPPEDVRVKKDVLHENTNQVADEDDGFAMARGWFVYAQEPIPGPDVMPGSTKPITDRRRQRRPRRMMTILFRQYPALAQQYSTERLQEEGWYDGSGWTIPGLFRTQGNRFSDGKPARVGSVGKGSLDGWERSLYYWRLHGESNHVKFPDQGGEEERTRAKAEKFWGKFRLLPGSLPQVRVEQLEPDDRPGFEAAKFLVEYDRMRTTSNYPSHYAQALVEVKPETVKARKLFHQARYQALHGDLVRARESYESPDGLEGWKKVLSENKDFRNQTAVQEYTFDVQLRYLRLLNGSGEEYQDRSQSALLAMLPTTATGGGAVSLGVVMGLPRIIKDNWQRPVFGGPFDEEVDGVPLISEQTRNQVYTRRGMQSATPPPTGKSRPGGPERAMPPVGSRPAKVVKP